MNDHLTESSAPEPRLVARRIFVEALLVAVIGAAFAFAANRISPRGLTLTYNYLGGTNDSVAAPITAVAPAGGATTNPLSAAELLLASLKANGLQAVDGGQAAQLFRDPRCQQQLIVFVDARPEEEYQAGHIPGAYPFDNSDSLKHITSVLPACQAAEQIVVYCRGGNCTDSELAAMTLRDNFGITNRKLFVYTGGITEWESKSLPVEIGARNSGKLRNANP